MAPERGRLFDACGDILAAVVAGYVVEGVELPDRQLVSIGPPVWDIFDDGCGGGVVAVWGERGFGHAADVATEAFEPRRAAPGHVLRGMQVRVQVARCVPCLQDQNGNPMVPSAAEEEAAAETLLTDAQLIQNIVLAAEPQLVLCNDIAFTDWGTTGPDGCMAAVTVGFRMNIGRL